MYDKIRYCWNVFYYILWHFDILFSKCIAIFFQNTFFLLLPDSLRDKANENLRKGMPRLYDRDLALEIPCGYKELYGLAYLHAFYIAFPLGIISVKIKMINDYEYMGIVLGFMLVMHYIAKKLTYEDDERKMFFIECEKKDKQWLIKWYVITFSYYIFTAFSSTFGVLYLVDLIMSSIS